MFLGIIEMLYFKCDIRPNNRSRDVCTLGIPMVAIASLMQSTINWKQKSLFMVASRALQFFKYYYAFGKHSSS